MNAFEIPGLRYSLPAGGAIERNRFVSVNSSSAGIQATAATQVVGASMNKTSAGEVIEIADGLVVVEASAAITAGDAVASTADGKAVTFSTGVTGDACGIAITGATGAGSLLTVKIS